MIASLIARYEFADPDELIEIIDSAGTPCADGGEQERKRCKKKFTVDCQAYKLDQTARWHEWVAALGVRVKGLRSLPWVSCIFSYKTNNNLFWAMVFSETCRVEKRAIVVSEVTLGRFAFLCGRTLHLPPMELLLLRN